MINRVVLVGRLTKDIDLRKTPNGASVVQFTIACNRRVKQQGQPDADYINCVAWNKIADLMSQYLNKGSLIGIEGRIQTRNYDDKDGKRVYVTEIITDSIQFLESKKHDEQNTVQNNYSQDWSKPQYNPTVNGQEFGDTLDIVSDDLPF